MGLSDIAAGIEVTTRQEERGVAAVDATGGALADRLAPHEDALPCTPAAAATVLETHARGVSVGASAREAGVAPVTAAKALHRCGVAGVSPLAPVGRRVVRDWLAGELSRTDALELVGGDDAEFALAAYVEAHEPVAALADVARGVAAGEDAGAVTRAALRETMTDAADLR